MTNKEIANQFSLLSKIMDIHGSDPFKAKSYANTAFAIDKLPNQIEDTGIESIEGHRGIGKGAINGILEIMDDGELALLKEYLVKTPEGVLELLKIKGLGPKKIKTLWQEYQIDSPAALLNLCKENKLLEIKGFSSKSQTNILEKVEFYFDNQNKLLWAQAEVLLPEIEEMLRGLRQSRLLSGQPDSTTGQNDTTNGQPKPVEGTAIKYAITGDYYWHNEIVERFDLVINQSMKNNLRDDWVLKEEDDNTFTYQFKDTYFFKFICVDENDFDREAFIHSFSDELKAQIDFSKILVFETEVKAFETLEMEYLPNYLRNNPAALEKSQQKSLPTIISNTDIKGVIHNHTNWSDGKHTIEEMAQGCIDRGYEYFVLSDHSQTSYYANGLSPDRIYKQQQEIDEVNARLKPFRIFKSIECDILGDGSLDYDEEVLSSFDLVICSVHQHLDMTEDKAMSRLITAIENPFTSIIGHATGRLLLTRAGYPLNHKKIIDACAANDVVLEINANPRRLDLDWRWIHYALEQDVMLSINPDAHKIEGIDDIRYGVQVAQKAMLPPAMNLSCFGLDEFEDFLRHQHEKRL